jgi:hypothetical protein
MSELIRAVLDKLYAFALPAALALGGFTLFVLPNSPKLTPIFADLTNVTAPALFVGLTAVLGFSLSALITPMYRILEGYLFWPPCLREWAIEKQRSRKQRLKSAIRVSGWLSNMLDEKIARYPLQDDQFLPTRFGNAIRSFESYGKTRFNLDSLTMEQELTAVVPQHIRSELDRARASVDFFVAVFYLSIAFGALSLGVAWLEGWRWNVIAIAAGGFISAPLWHWLAARATDAWGASVRALVNLGRRPLAESLGLTLPNAIEEERRMWGYVTGFVAFADLSRAKKLDDYRTVLISADVLPDAEYRPSFQEASQQVRWFPPQ